MSVLLKEIERNYPNEANTLKKAGLLTDSEIRSLSRVDLNELFPGVGNLKRRRNIFELIHKQKPINLLLNEMKAFIPHESFMAALTDNGVLAEYLHILKDIKTQVDSVQAFLDAHVDLLEKINKNKDFEPSSLPGASAPFALVTQPHNVQNQQGPQDSRFSNIVKFPGQESVRPVVRDPQQTQVTVKYKMEVTGRTFDAHQQLLQKVANQSLILEESPGNQDYQVFFVFCPIISRLGTDVEAAMSKFTGKEQEVILVLMHHTRDAKTLSLKILSDYQNVKLCVNVFYHETMHGLLNCQQNNDAVAAIQGLLQQYLSNNTSGNAVHVAGRSDGTDRYSAWGESSGIFSKIFSYK